MRRITNFGNTCNSTHIKGLLVGYNRNWTMKHPDADKVKIPFGITLATAATDALKQQAITLESLHQHVGVISCLQNTLIIDRLYLCLIFGIFFFLRKGEYLPSPKAKKDRQGNAIGYIFTRDMLSFYTKQDEVIPYDQVNMIAAVSVKLGILFSKADATGRGRVLFHYRQPEGAPICLVRTLEKWISLTRDTYRLTVNEIMWHVPGLSPLTSDTVAALMKATCTLVGLPPDKISAH